MPYLAENSAVTNLIQDLEEFDNREEEEERPGELSDPASSPLDGVSLDNVTNRLQMAGLDRWVARLKEANEKIHRHLHQPQQPAGYHRHRRD